MAEKKRGKKAAVVRIDDFRELSEEEQVERVKQMLQEMIAANDEERENG